MQGECLWAVEKEEFLDQLNNYQRLGEGFVPEAGSGRVALRLCWVCAR
jgi:hypothetical protein